MLGISIPIRRYLDREAKKFKGLLSVQAFQVNYPLRAICFRKIKICKNIAIKSQIMIKNSFLSFQ